MADWNLPPLSALGFTPYQPPPPELLNPLLGGGPPPIAGPLPPESPPPPPQPRSLGSWLHGGLFGTLNPLGLTPPPTTVMQSPGQTLTGQVRPPSPRTLTFGSGNPEAELLGSMLGFGGLARTGARALGPHAPALLSGGAAGATGVALSEPAGGQQPDSRVGAIADLDRQIREGETRLRAIATRRFPGRTQEDRDAAREAARDAELETLRPLRERRKQVQDSIDADDAAGRARELATRQGAEWRNTPWARAHPWLMPTTAGLGAALGFAMPFTRARSGVTAYNERLAGIEGRWRAALERASNTRLQPAARTEAANRARELQREFETALSATPAHGFGARLGAAGIGGASTDFGLMLPTGLDYISSAAEPTGELRRNTMSSLGSWETLGRLGLGFSLGGALGEIGHELGSRGINQPGGYRAETETLPRQYRRYRRR